MAEVCSIGCDSLLRDSNEFKILAAESECSCDRLSMLDASQESKELRELIEVMVEIEEESILHGC